MDESNKDVSQERKDEIVRDVIALLDLNGDSQISRDEFERFIAHGKTLPDMGTGPGYVGVGNGTLSRRWMRS